MPKKKRKLTEEELTGAVMFAVLDGVRLGKLRRSDGVKLIDARLKQHRVAERRRKPVEKPE